MRTKVNLYIIFILLLGILNVSAQGRGRGRRQAFGFGFPQGTAQNLGGVINSFLGGFLGPQQPHQNQGRPSNNHFDFFNSFNGGFNQGCNRNNGGCEQGCRMARGRPLCYCEEGYFLNQQDRLSCSDIDECLNGFHSPCQDHCTNTAGSFECSCTTGTLLPDKVSCGQGGTGGGGGTGGPASCNVNNGGCEHVCRRNRRGGIRCRCESGYTLGQDRKSCLDIDECSGHHHCHGLVCTNTIGSYLCGSEGEGASQRESCHVNNGGCHHRCREKRNGKLQCNCRRGFTLQADKKSCTRGNEPTQPSDPCQQNNGGCQHNCVNNHGSSVCNCNQDFQLINGRFCQPIVVEPVDPCLQNNGGCQDICVNNHGSSLCQCQSGFQLINGRFCQQIVVDPCLQNNGGCQDICVNNQGSSVCQCQPGFQLINGRFCQPIVVDPCLQNNGGCQDICVNNQGNVVCQCQPGFQLINGRFCQQIVVDPCLQNNGGCQDICVNNQGSVVCQCQPGFQLISGRFCQRVITLPTVTIPPTTPPPPQTLTCGVNTKKSLFRRIVGGRPADPKDWPWMAALLRTEGNSQFCGGTLITTKHVLTAAHCVFQFTTTQLRVRLGEYNFDTPDENNPTDFRVAEIRKHENYNTNTQENDIAILKLGRASTFSEFIWPACLPPAGNDFEDQLGYVTGWGTIHFGGPVSRVLQEVVIPVWNHTACVSAYPENLVTDKMMCAGRTAGGQDSCQGDSGGPFLAQIFPKTNWYVAGIVSWGIECASPNRPGVYTRVNKYLNWISANSVV